MPSRYSIVGQAHRGLDSYLTGTLPGVAVVLVRDPDNQYDPNAIMVWIDGKHVGYLPRNAKFARSPNSAYPQVEVNHEV